MTAILRWLLAMVAALAASYASANFHLFIISQIYSNADGTVQYVELRNTGGDGENLLGGHTLTSTSSKTGVTKSLPFPNDLPSNTANKKVLIATQGFADLGLVMPDYIMPNGFLATDGATVNYAGVSQMSFGDAPLTPLPTDGVTALTQGGTAANAPTNFAGATTTLAALPVTAVEFYRQVSDHYFMSALQPDIDALDSGRLAGWARTGFSFKVFPTQAAGGAGTNPVCRFYIPPQHGDSHFFSADPIVECPAILAKIQTDPNYSGYDYETPNAFYIALPDTMTGACPAGTIAVYRLWNQRADSNHRYTTDLSIKAQMLAKGYLAEGYGPDSVIMCAPA
jgi:hypothetical protein